MNQRNRPIMPMHHHTRAWLAALVVLLAPASVVPAQPAITESQIDFVAAHPGGGTAVADATSTALFGLLPIEEEVFLPLTWAREPAPFPCAPPLSFEANEGQWHPGVDFVMRGAGYHLLLTSEEAVLVLAPANADASHSLRIRAEGGHPHASLSGEVPLPGRVNYLFGHDSAQWRTNIATFAKVRAREVYPGIDLVYYGSGRSLEFDFIVAPGADPGRIALLIEGAEALSADAEGNLHAQAGGAEIQLMRPVVFQEIGGKKIRINAEYTQGVKVAGDLWRVAFDLGVYDRQYALIIDPVVSYATYLGGTDGESIYGVAVDSAGSAYVTGWTISPDLPTTAGAFQASLPAWNGSAFVSKFDASGTNLLFSTYFGGSGGETDNTSGNMIAVDQEGRVVIAGWTSTAHFPLEKAIQSEYGGIQDAFVAQLTPDGSGLLFSTFLGGSSYDVCNGLALDRNGAIYVAGFTRSSDFPLQSPMQATLVDGEGFIAKIDPSKGALVYSTFLGAPPVDGWDRSVRGIQVDDEGRVYFAGHNSGVFFGRMNSTGTALDFLKTNVLGVNGNISGLALDRSSNMYLTGTTQSSTLAVTPDAYQQAPKGSEECFVGKFDTVAQQLSYLTYLGGRGREWAEGIAVDAGGHAYVTGRTDSTDFPMRSPLQSQMGGGYDAFIAKLAPDGSDLVWSTYYGGGIGTADFFGAADAASSIALDQSGGIYVAGSTRSTDFPTTNAFQPAIQITPAPKVSHDAFLLKLQEPQPPPTLLIQRSGEWITISWPSTSNLILERSEVLGPAARWIPEPAEPDVLNDLNTVRLISDGQALFFRLRQ